MLSSAALTLGGVTRPLRNVVHADYAPFVISKPQIEPLETQQYLQYADEAKTRPTMLMCKGKSADHVVAVYGPGEILPGHDRREVRAAIDRVLASVPGITTSIGQPIEHRLSHVLSGTPAALAVVVQGADVDTIQQGARRRRVYGRRGEGHRTCERDLDRHIDVLDRRRREIGAATTMTVCLAGVGARRRALADGGAGRPYHAPGQHAVVLAAGARTCGPVRAGAEASGRRHASRPAGRKVRRVLHGLEVFIEIVPAPGECGDEDDEGEDGAQHRATISPRALVVTSARRLAAPAETSVAYTR